MKQPLRCDYCDGPLPEPECIKWTIKEKDTPEGTYRYATGMYCSARCQARGEERKWDGLKKY